MAHVVKSSNLFAILHEETRILRRKEKKERAEQRKLLKQQLRQQNREELLDSKLEPVKNKKWSEITDDKDDEEDDDDDDDDEDDDDDDDDDDENLSHATSLDKEGHLPKIDEDDDANETLEENIPYPQLKETDLKQKKSSDRKQHEKRTDRHAARKKPAEVPIESEQSSKECVEIITSPIISTDQPLTRKERIEQEKKQLDELQHLLKNYGLNVPTDEQVDSNSEKGNKASRKRKKKKNDMTSLKPDASQSEAAQSDHTLNPDTKSSLSADPKAHAQSEEKSSIQAQVKSNVSADTATSIDMTNHPSISREDLPATVKLKAVAVKRKAKSNVPVISETVLAEAKKKSQLQKSKEKKDKSKFRY